MRFNSSFQRKATNASVPGMGNATPHAEKMDSDSAIHHIMDEQQERINHTKSKYTGGV